ncbi:DUF7269 family protein [Natronomonas amylolytica]|uniref:DUF7269 family protein n=1 Tax=Natronomonas amylolytica TaxID=3108498 RepID=UPI00300A474F
MSERVGWRGLITALGVVGIGLAALLVFVPDVADPLGIERLANAASVAEGGDRAFWLAAVGACCLLWVARTAGLESDAEGFPAHTGAADDGTVPTVGRGFDAAVEAAADAAVEGADHDDARGTLRSLAADVVAHADGCSREDAAERVRRGAWTDDPVAAAYLADAVDPPFRWRVRAWFRPRRTVRRRIDRTVAAIEERMEARERR